MLSRREGDRLLATAAGHEATEARWTRFDYAPGWLRTFSTAPAFHLPRLGAVTRLGAAGTVLGVGLDVHNGTSVPLAVFKGAAGLVGAAAGTALFVAAAPEVVAGALLVGATVIFGTALGMAASAAATRIGPPLGRATAGAARATGRALAHAGSGLGHAFGRMLQPMAP